MTGLGGTPWGGEKKGYSVNLSYLSSLFVYFPATVYLFFIFFSSFEVVSILLSMIKKIRAEVFCSMLNRERRQGVRLAYV